MVRCLRIRKSEASHACDTFVSLRRLDVMTRSLFKHKTHTIGQGTVGVCSSTMELDGTGVSRLVSQLLNAGAACFADSLQATRQGRLRTRQGPR
jgi:hypothetical protein